MLLKELEKGKRFVFEDQSTPLQLYNLPGNQVTAKGTFKYLGMTDHTCPRLFHLESACEYTVAMGNYNRYIIQLL